MAKIWNPRPCRRPSFLVCRYPWSVYSSYQSISKKNRPQHMYAAMYGLLEPWMLDDSWTPTVTALFTVFFVILAFWISFTGLFVVCLISWVEKLILKATVEPRFRPCAVAHRCLALFNCLQQSMSATFFAFFVFSQTDFMFAQSKHFTLPTK